MKNILDSQEEEILILELWTLFLSYKKQIFLITSIITVFSVIYSLSIPKYYQSSILMVSSNSSSQKMGGLSGLIGSALGAGSGQSFNDDQPDFETVMAVITSRKFLENYIQENNLLPIIYKDIWDEKAKKFTTQNPRMLSDAFETIQGAIEINLDSTLITMTIEWDDPKFATMLANQIVERLNDFMRNQTIEEGKKSIIFLEGEVQKTDISNSKAILFNLIETQMQKIMLANVREEYVLNVIDPAVEPQFPSGPNRKIIVIFG